MAYVALKPCCFAGQKFRIGDRVPDELIHPGSVKNLVSYGVIAEADTEGVATTTNPVASPAATRSILVRAESGEMELEPTDEGIQDVFTVLIGKTADAESVINQMTDGDALILLHMADSRKAVKAAAEARAKALSPEESAGEL